MTKILDDLKESEAYKKILEKMSDEERQQAEMAAAKLLGDFERNILGPLKETIEKIEKK